MNQHARGVGMSAEYTHRLARLDQQSLVLLEPFERLDDLVVSFPVARGAADAAIDDQALRILGDLLVEVVHQHPHRRLGGPVPGLDLAAPAGANVAAVVASVGGHMSLVIASTAKQSSFADSSWIASSLRSSQ